jgi:GT2 family glycosyltransferase
MASQKVKIVTPVHNRRDETLHCLRSIVRADASGLQLHIIVVDDGSTDGTADAIKIEFPDVEIVHGDGNLWYTAGTNRGIEAAMRHEPDYILAINNDSVFDEKCIISLVECAQRHPRSVVGALLLNRETPHRVFQVSPRWELLGGGFRHWQKQTVWTVPAKPWHVDIIVGNCVLYPIQAIKEAGLMDEKRLAQFGDAEYTPRMKRMGWNLLIEPRARVFCKPNDLVSGFMKQPFRKKFELLFTPTSPYSIQRRFYGSVGGAPNKLLGLLTIPVFVVRYLFGRTYESSWSLTQDEEPLSKTFASAVVDD